MLPNNNKNNNNYCNLIVTRWQWLFNFYPTNAPNPFKSVSYERTKQVRCGHLNAPHTTVHLLCCYFHIMITVTYSNQATAPAVKYLPHNVYYNTLHSCHNNTVQLQGSPFHIMFIATHSIQATIELSTCGDVYST